MVQFGNIEGSVSRSGVSLKPKKKKQAQAELEPYGPPRYVPPTRNQLYRGDPEAPPFIPRLLTVQEQQQPLPERFYGNTVGTTMPTPQIPSEQMAPPTYEEPERPGWKRTLLGIGLSGAANLSGQGPRAADSFFIEPERRAERDYARELGAYSANRGEWSDYYDQVMQQQTLDLQQRRLEEEKKANIEARNRPFNVSRGGSLVSPGGQVRFQDPYGQFGATNRQGELLQAYNVWLENNPGRSMEDMTYNEKNQAWSDYRQFHGMEATSQVFGPGNIVTRRPRSESYDLPGPVTTFGPGGPQTGGQQGVQLNQPQRPRQYGLTASQRTEREIDRETEMVSAVDDEQRDSIRKKYDAVFVRGVLHDEGEKLSRARALDYIRIARAELGPDALNASVEMLAEAWAQADGYDTTTQ